MVRGKSEAPAHFIGGSSDGPCPPDRWWIICACEIAIGAALPVGRPGPGGALAGGRRTAAGPARAGAARRPRGCGLRGAGPGRDRAGARRRRQHTVAARCRARAYARGGRLGAVGGLGRRGPKLVCEIRAEIWPSRPGADQSQRWPGDGPDERGRQRSGGLGLATRVDSGSKCRPKREGV